MSKSKGARSQREADLAAVVASPPAEAEGGRDGSNGGSAGVKSAKDLESAGPSAAKSPEGQAKSLEGQP